MSVQDKLKNLYTQQKQATVIQNPNPPNMASVPKKVLESASVPGFDFNVNTRTDTTSIEKANANCMTYNGIEGLRKLKSETLTRSVLDSGCGWLYKPSAGISPEINRGSFGSQQGSLEKNVPAGATFYWDLDDAEMEITKKICNNATKCRHLAVLGKFADVCGYCKASGAIIPIEKQTDGSYTARYKGIPSLSCDAKEVLGGANLKCPDEGFANYSSFTPKNTNEGFTSPSLDDLDKCSSANSTECKVIAARLAGCSDEGSLIKLFLSGADPKKNMAFVTYQQLSQSPMASQLFTDGSVSMKTAIDDFQTLIESSYSSNKKLSLAAKDLAFKQGEINTFDFCSEIQSTTPITDMNINCLQEDWKQSGGTESGTFYPLLKDYKNQTYANYLTRKQSVLNRINSTNKATNALGIQQFIGINTKKSTEINLVKNSNTRGAEVIWFTSPDKESFVNGTQKPIVLRSDLNLQKYGDVIPYFTNIQELKSKYNVPGDNTAFITTFEVRPSKPIDFKIEFSTDDGVAIGINQNPFENKNNKDDFINSWKFQPPTRYTTPIYKLNADSENTKNIVNMRWFNGAGLGQCKSSLILDTLKVESNNIQNAELYLTQEPLAPWLQYEVGKKLNNGVLTTSLLEKRFNGPIAFQFKNASVKTPSFDIEQKGLQTNEKNKVVSFTMESQWKTKALFAYSSVRTMTLLINPDAALAPGSEVHVFSHGVLYTITLYNSGSNYQLRFWDGKSWSNRDVAMNEWNFILIQYQVDSDNSVRNLSFHVQAQKTLLNSSTSLQTFLNEMKTAANNSSGFLYDSSKKSAGSLTLGQNGNLQGFRGDVKWIHGFRDKIDTLQSLRTELNNSWISRWPN